MSVRHRIVSERRLTRWVLSAMAVGYVAGWASALLAALIRALP